ncbi:MAG: 2OG-Fe(II) oxygenase [Myxococcales bacterium]|nr:2OG-Fe(II) oxygenase [Myxococcales bacterium]
MTLNLPAPAEFHRALPFPHAVIPDAIAPDELAALAREFETLTWQPDHNDLVMALMAPPPPGGAIAQLIERWQTPEQLARWSALIGEPLVGLVLSAWQYTQGCYLLPHTDADPHRRIAVVVHVSVDSPGGVALAGGALRLFEQASDEGPDSWRIHSEIPTKPGSVVIFEASEVALHAVGEVTAGRRLTLAGWLLTSPDPVMTTRVSPPLPPVHVAAQLLGDAQRNEVRQTQLQTRDVADQGRYQWADLAPTLPVVREISAWASAALTRPLRVVRARLLRLSAGDYTLHKDDVAQRHPDEIAHAIVDVSAEAHGQAIATWHRKPYAVLARPQTPGDAVVVMRTPGVYLWQHYVPKACVDVAVWRLDIGFAEA